MNLNDEISCSIGYNKDTGDLFWLRDAIRGSKLKAGRSILSKDVHGYIQINLSGNVLKGHRVAWFLHYGSWPDGQIDHINHNRSDNRICNLRVVDNTENHRNRPKQSNNKTGVVGVCVHKKSGLYRAYINFDGKQKNLGYFKNLDEAKEARRLANIEYGFHENHGSSRS